MNETLEMITNNVRLKYPHMLEEGIKITDYYFWDCKNNSAIPSRDLKVVKQIITAKNITDFALVIFFSNNIIGYRLDI
jgi:hypothetical protein